MLEDPFLEPFLDVSAITRRSSKANIKICRNKAVISQLLFSNQEALNISYFNARNNFIQVYTCVVIGFLEPTA